MLRAFLCLTKRDVYELIWKASGRLKKIKYFSVLVQHPFSGKAKPKNVTVNFVSRKGVMQLSWGGKSGVALETIFGVTKGIKTEVKVYISYIRVLLTKMHRVPFVCVFRALVVRLSSEGVRRRRRCRFRFDELVSRSRIRMACCHASVSLVLIALMVLYITV